MSKLEKISEPGIPSSNLELELFGIFSSSDPELWKIPGSNPELGKISRFRPGTRKNFLVPTRNLEKFPGFDPELEKFLYSDPKYSGLFPGCFALFSNLEKSWLFQFSGWNPEPGIPVETLTRIINRNQETRGKYPEDYRTPFQGHEAHINGHI